MNKEKGAAGQLSASLTHNSQVVQVTQPAQTTYTAKVTRRRTEPSSVESPGDTSNTITGTSDPRLAEAIFQVSQGRRVFVLGRSKRPLANCSSCQNVDDAHRQTCECLTCHGHLAATNDPERIAAMLAAHPRGLLALRTGAVSGVVVVDIDPRNGGHVDLEIMLPTLGAKTGGGGWHLWYQHPGGHVPSRELPGRPGVDIKGDGGYCVLPPSMHPDTKEPYRWLPSRPLIEMHPALLSLVTAPPAAHALPVPRQSGPISFGSSEKITNPERLLESILDRVRTAPEAMRRRTLYGAARGTAKMVAAGALTSTEAVNALVHAAHVASAAGRDRLTQAQINAAITGGFRAEGVTA